MLVETVNRLERQQQLHQKLLQQICDPDNNLAITLGICPDLLQKLQEGSTDESPEPSSKKRRIEEVNSETGDSSLGEESSSTVTVGVG